MEQAVLVFRPVGCEQARYYLDGPGPGRWVGAGCAELGLDGDVDGAVFAAALAGRGPYGSPLLARIPRNRRAGFDLVFAAPKSVSLLAALAPAADSAKLRSSHAAAVADAVGYLGRWAARTRRGGDGRLIATGGLVGAAFDHGTSWAGDPHLHTHVVVANLVRGIDGRWSCLHRTSLWQHARAAGALYQASLRHHLARCGLNLAWQVRADGLADVAGVPRAAIDACSSRRRQLLSEAAAAGPASARARRGAAGRTRRSFAGPVRGWEARAAEAGLDRATVTNLLSTPAPAVTAAAAVEDVLIGRSSAFTRSDVVAAAAATAPVEAGPAEVEEAVDRFLGAAVRVDDRQWTTPRAQALERAMVAAVDTGWRSAGLVPPATVEAAMTARPNLDPEEQAAVRRLTTGGSGVEVLAPGCLVRHAAVVDAATAAWEAAGHRVAVITRSDRAAARWQALTALEPPPSLPHRPSVLIVDAADHWPTIALHRMVEDLSARGGKLVLVTGGTTRPRREPASAALTAMAERVGTMYLTLGHPTLGPIAETVRAGRDGTVVIAPTAADAAKRLVADWHAALSRGQPATIVALGPDEAEHLNRLARAARTAAGELAGPVLTAGTRDFQRGDDVRVVRRDHRLGIPTGRLGRVTVVDPDRREATIWWGDRSQVVAASTLAGGAVTHGYATTAPFLRHSQPGAVLSLGPCAGRDATMYAVSPLRARRPGMDRVEELLEALNPPAGAVPTPAGRSLADLAAEQGRLGSDLLATVPPDRSAELRRLEEDRAWLTATSGHVAELNRSHEALTQEQGRRSAWLEAHRDDLERWAALGAAAVWRAEALAMGAELAPTRAVVEQLGLPPPGGPSRQTWRRLAGMIEAYRDRWAAPDGPLPRLTTPDPAWDRARQVDQLRLLNACRAGDRNLGPGLAPDDDLVISAG